MNTHVAKSSDLAGPMNPTGIVDAKYLILVSALQRDDHPDNVKQALFDWLSKRNIRPGQIEVLLQQDPDTAANELVRMIGGGMQRVPSNVVGTLRKALSAVGRDVLHREGKGIASKIASLRGVRSRYRSEAVAEAVLH